MPAVRSLAKTLLTLALLLVALAGIGVLGVRYRSMPQEPAGPGAGAAATAGGAEAAQETPSVPLQPYQQELLKEARAGQTASMRKLARSLIGGDTTSHIDAPSAAYWARKAVAAGDPLARPVAAAVEGYLRRARPEDRAAAALPPSEGRQAHLWLLSYAAAYELCGSDGKRAGCFEPGRKVLAEAARLPQAWQQVMEWPAHASEDEALEARRTAAYLRAFGLQPFGLPPQRTPMRRPEDAVLGRAELEELARGGDLRDKLMLAFALLDDNPPDVARAKPLADEITSATDPKQLSDLRAALLEQPAQGGWTRRAHDRVFLGVADPTSQYLRRAADAGAFNEAQTLGLAYFFGGPYFAGLSVDQWDIAGIKQDHTAAMKYLERAQSSGRRESAAILGALLLGGNGVAHDYDRGMTLMRDAARRGSLWALGTLAQIYGKGNFGVEKAPAAGYALANIAVRLAPTAGAAEQLVSNLDEAGIEMAKTALADLQELVAPPQLARLQEQTRDWMPGAALPSTATGKGVLNGTAVLVSAEGHMLTNAHVVKGCKTVRLSEGGDEGTVVRVDTHNDLALLRFPQLRGAHVALRDDAPNLGEPVTVFGFPLVGPLSAAGNVTNGIVSSEAGFEDNSLQFQFTAPVQSGSSGGPVLDDRGRLVGVILGKLNAELTARATGETPQNANFGIKNVAVAAFLKGAAVDVRRAPFYAGWPSRSPEQLAQDARDASRRIECSP